MGTTIKRGDRIRVVIEGPVLGVGWASYDAAELAEAFVAEGLIALNDRDVVSVEKVEPPVRVFQPGDVVQGREFGGVYAIVDHGSWVCVSAPSTRKQYVGETGSCLLNWFNSERYQKVSLG